MGWDTEIVIIAEKVKNKKEASDLSKLIVEKDARSYGQVSCFVKNSEILFLHYKRRKYAPYWVIQDISKEFLDANFTILASCPDFVGGPAGIIRISEGEILDSYGIGEANKSIIRESLISDPLNYVQLIYEWFGFNGKEKLLRMNHLTEYPIGWCEENYVDKIIPIVETQELTEKYHQGYTDLVEHHWTELKNKII